MIICVEVRVLIVTDDEHRGLDVSLLVSEKLVFIESDLGDDLGIAAALYEEV
jgi:hypothetical protein